jgi:ubiquinone/menaquinone biosynthesis C-methylase UbiE
MREEQIKKAYQQSQLYDSMIRMPLWARVGSALVWGFSELDYVKAVLSFIPHEAITLLDIPVGTAALTYKKYAEMPSSKIIAVDYSEDMLHIAKQRFQSNRMENVKLVQGDVGNLPFKEESMDVVLSMNGFHAFPDKPAAFRETARVLKKGGLFIGCFYIKGQRAFTDFFIERVYVPKGYFTPPFSSREEVSSLLHQLYTKVEIQNQKSIVYFQCVK